MDGDGRRRNKVNKYMRMDENLRREKGEDDVNRRKFWYKLLLGPTRY